MKTTKKELDKSMEHWGDLTVREFVDLMEKNILSGRRNLRMYTPSMEGPAYIRILGQKFIADKKWIPHNGPKILRKRGAGIDLAVYLSVGGEVVHHFTSCCKASAFFGVSENYFSKMKRAGRTEFRLMDMKFVPFNKKGERVE